MFKVIIYTQKNDSSKKGARLVVDLGYTQVVLSWSACLCAEVLKISTLELMSKDPQTIVVK